MDQIIKLIDRRSSVFAHAKSSDFARQLNKSVEELTTQDVLLLLDNRSRDPSFPAEMYVAMVLDIQAEARNNKLCAEIAKLTALIEQRLPAPDVPAETRLDDPMTDTSTDANTTETTAPAVDTSAATTPQLSPVYTDWVAQNIHLVKEKSDRIWTREDENMYICDYLATNGLLDILKEAPITKYLDRSAVQTGQLHVIKWLVESGRTINKHFVFQIAAGRGYLHILEYMQETFPDTDFVGKSDYYAVSTAAGKGMLHVIKWFESVGKMNATAVQVCAATAAAFGNFDIVKYVISTYPIPSPWEVARKAANGGHRSIIQLLSINGLINRAIVPDLIVAAEQHPRIVVWLKAMYE